MYYNMYLLPITHRGDRKTLKVEGNGSARLTLKIITIIILHINNNNIIITQTLIL